MPYFLLYGNNMKTELKNCNLLLDVDDRCLLHSHQNVRFIERNLNSDFNNLCKWFIDNRLSIHKSNLPLTIIRNENTIKQYSLVE